MSFESFYKRRLTHSTNTKIQTEALPKRCASLKECIYRANLVNSIDLHSPKFRPPDIGHRENVRFPCISGSGSGGRGRGAAMGRRAGEGEADARWRANREAHAQARAREDRRRLIEELAQCLRGARSMRRAERCQRDVQLAVADADVA